MSSIAPNPSMHGEYTDQPLGSGALGEPPHPKLFYGMFIDFISQEVSVQ
jgi:hypothetical protein